jgi:biopolymer transport protein ExbD
MATNMTFGNSDWSAETAPDVMNEINMTPFVDVMLVLLIVFMLAIPVVQHAVSVQLPNVTSTPQDAKPETIQLSVDATGNYFWNQTPVAQHALAGMLRAEAAKPRQPDLHIRADKAVRYDYVAQAMAAAQQAGLRKIGFITEPATLR